jgi:hypothetical protein
MFFCGRGEMARWISEIFYAFHRNWEKLQKIEKPIYAFKALEADADVTGEGLTDG